MEKTKSKKRRLEGVVLSDKSEKTIVVKVTTRSRHPKYNKFVISSKKFHAHDESQKAKTGDLVTIVESRAFSKTKKWELVRVN